MKMGSTGTVIAFITGVIVGILLVYYVFPMFGIKLM